MALSLSTALVAAGMGAFSVLGAGTPTAATPAAPAAAPITAPVALAAFTTDDQGFRFRCEDWRRDWRRDWQRWDDQCFRNNEGDRHDEGDHHNEGDRHNEGDQHDGWHR